MIKNFEEVKQQLREFADIVNSYKSEAVQLRLVELVLGASVEAPAGKPAESPVPERRNPIRRRRTPKNGSNETDADTSSPRPNRSGRMGGKAALARLYDEGFFKSAKSINDIVQHSATHLATRLKQSDFSGALARYVRAGKLTRSKNNDNQYEYTQA
jgi:hypothetical protein